MVIPSEDRSVHPITLLTIHRPIFFAAAWASHHILLISIAINTYFAPVLLRVVLAGASFLCEASTFVVMAERASIPVGKMGEQP